MVLSAINNAQVAINFNASATLNVTGFQQPISGNVGLQFLQQYSLGTGAGQVDEIINITHTITAGATWSPTLSGTFTDICGETVVSLSAIRTIMVQLLNASQNDGAGNVGTACSGVTIGADGSNPWSTGPFGATDVYVIANGGRWLHVDTTSAGLGVVGSDVLKVVNNDGAVNAYLQLTIFGVH